MNKWKELKPATGVIYKGILEKIMTYDNKAEWTGQHDSDVRGQSRRYYIKLIAVGPNKLSEPEYVYVFGNKMMNKRLAGVYPGDVVAFVFKGLQNLRAMDSRGRPYKRYLVDALYQINNKCQNDQSSQNEHSGQ